MSEARPRAMRLLLYTDAADRAGAEQSMANLLSHLGDHIDVWLAGLDRSVVEWVATHRPGTKTRLLPAVHGKLDVAPMWAHVRAVREIKPDIFHANLPWTFSCQYGLLAALATPGVRVIAVDQCPMPAASRLQRLRKRELAKRLDANVAPGQRAARLVERFVGLPPGSVRSIYNGVPVRSADVPARPSSGLVVGSLGRLTFQKRFDVLVEALPRLPGVTLVLVGDGPDRAALESRARELGVAGRLQITGWTDDARSYLSSFDVFVLPSRFEGFPLVIPEAMLAGLPVVATDVGSVAEAVIDGETGHLVPAGEIRALEGALGRLIADPEARRRMGERGRALALERFTAATMARAFESLYAEVLG